MPTATTSYTLTCTGSGGSASGTATITVNITDAGWTNVVNDQFNTDGAVPSHWGLYDGPYGSTPNNCAAPSQDYVSGGSLHLLMSYLPSGNCGAAWYTGGMQLAKADASTDQRITVRYRVVDTNPNVVLAHRIIPMHFGDVQTPSWPYGGEADYCEGARLTGCDTFLHYFGTTTNDQIYHSSVFDLTQWNVIRIERRNHTVTVYINNMSTAAWFYTGDSATLPDVAQRVVLQQECRSSGCPAPGSDTEDVQIDWVVIDNPA